MIENLTIPRVLNLSDTADRRLLKEAAERSPALLALINRYLDDYLRLFPEAHFRKIYSGGIIGVTSKSNATAGSDILRMLQLTERLVALEKYQGFPCLLNGFRNPTQFESTRFEVAVASWCDSRRVTVSLAFSPTVSRKGRQKTPELLWETTLGDLYYECKREHLNESAIKRRMERLMNVIEAAYTECGQWDPVSRVDVRIGQPAKDGVERLIRELIRTLHAKQSSSDSERIEQGVVSIDVGARTTPCPIVENSMRMMSVQVGSDKPTKLDDSNARFSLTMSLFGHRLRLLTKLIRDARSQLPDSTNGGIFLDIGAGEQFRVKLGQLLGHSVYANTPFASLWSHDAPECFVWRQGQPFDDRLLVPRT